MSEEGWKTFFSTKTPELGSLCWKGLSLIMINLLLKELGTSLLIQEYLNPESEGESISSNLIGVFTSSLKLRSGGSVREE